MMRPNEIEIKHCHTFILIFIETHEVDCSSELPEPLPFDKDKEVGKTGVPEFADFEAFWAFADELLLATLQLQRLDSDPFHH